ncbi:HNH endonuclease [Rhodococcoides yunnanense]|uniref:HNH endonuclease n=1 Tax=Rhodococcoides yunnanense TaxID=278209 RepID=UPI0012E11F31|nr:HNH endonuclease signature motif containing protein [Rhodococcus yunnanensis]
MAGLVGVSARWRVVENVARARVVEAVCEVADVRLEEALCSGGDAAEALWESGSEVAAGLGLSQRVARPLVEVGLGLERLPLTAVRFVCGVLDWAKVVELVSVLGRAGDATIAALEFEAVAAAGRLAPLSLRSRLWRMWMGFDAAEASAAKAAASIGVRGVDVRGHRDGTTRLTAALSDLEGAEAEALIVEICGSVCGRDPRSGRELRADGLMALLHGEHALVCACDAGQECAQFGVADLPDGRRGPLVQILFDVQTLLGLTSEPAVLPDGSALDADVARVIAGDAVWQAMLTEMMTVHAGRAAASTSTGESDEPDAASDSSVPSTPADASTSEKSSTPEESSKTEGTDDLEGSGGVAEDPESDSGSESDSDCVAAVSDSDAPAGSASATGSGYGAVLVPRLIARGRIRPGGAVPAPTAPAPTGSAPTGSGSGSGCFSGGLGATDEALRAQVVSELLAAIAADPALALGVFPDGHGGYRVPPPGALTYRPSAEVAARVRMTYSTCTHHDCSVPSTQCELDHIVPFDHQDPVRGGWSIESNLQPSCTSHHRFKTAQAWAVAMLAGGAIVWTSRSGLRTITLPDLGCPRPPRKRRRGRRTRETASTPDTAAQDTATPDTSDRTAPDTSDRTVSGTTASGTAAADTAASDATVPDAPGPDTTASDGTASETAASDTTDPEATASDVPASDTTASDTTASDVPASDTTASDTPAPETPEWWEAPTWWEKNMPTEAESPTLADMHAAESEAARTKVRIIRRRFREHNLARWHRARNEKPPF